MRALPESLGGSVPATPAPASPARTASTAPAHSSPTHSSPAGTPSIAGAEATTPSLVDVAQVRNVTELLVARHRAAPEHIAFEVREPGAPLDQPWRQVSTREFMEEVTNVARGLLAAGIAVGSTVLIMAPTQYRWAVADQAALFIGAIVVPVYDTASDAQLQGIIADARPAAAFAGDAALARRINLAARLLADQGQSVPAPRVWTLTEHTGTALRSSESLSELVEIGRDIAPQALESRRLTAGLSDVATIVYTSGTTGAPKGALITHANLVGQVLNTAAAYREVVKETGSTILFLPLTHVLGRALQLICIANGMRIAHLADPKDVVRALPILRPTFLVVVPRVLEKIVSAAAASARDKRLSAVWASAERTARAWGSHLEERDLGATRSAPLSLRLRRALFDRLFYRRLRAVMGDRIEFLLSGAATLQPELAHFFRGIGVPVIEGYGLTETTAPLTGGRPGALVAGRVGPPLPGNTVRIAENGEVLASGVGVFAGYRDPALNAAAFVDGYFRTGDLGSLDADGCLSLHGRLKHVIVTSTGRTVSPERWEQAVEAEPLIAHAAMVGTDRPYLTALLVLDRDALEAWCRAHGEVAPPPPHDDEIRVVGADSASAAGRTESESHAVGPTVETALRIAVERANAAAPPAERVQYWRAVAIGGGRDAEFVTPTMKLKHQALLSALTPTVEELYR